PRALAGPGRAHGADQLPAAVGGLHPGVLQLRPGLLRADAARLAGGVRAGAVRAAGDLQPRLAGAFPLRADGVAVALGHLPAPAADAPARAARGRARLTRRPHPPPSSRPWAGHGGIASARTRLPLTSRHSQGAGSWTRSRPRAGARAGSSNAARPHAGCWRPAWRWRAPRPPPARPTPRRRWPRPARPARSATATPPGRG